MVHGMGVAWSEGVECREPRTRSTRKQVLFETLQSVQSVELFNFKRAPRARERQGTPGSARERLGGLIFT